MSYELTSFRSFAQHDPGCSDCTKLRPNTHIHVDSLKEELRKNIQKKLLMERKVRMVSLEVAELERMIRQASREGRRGFKYQLTNRLAVHAGLLHMLLRYNISTLKQDR